MTRRPAPDPELLELGRAASLRAAAITPRIAEHEQARLDLARERRDEWKIAHDSGLSYASIGADSGVHASQVEKALKRPMESTRPTANVA